MSVWEPSCVFVDAFSLEMSLWETRKRTTCRFSFFIGTMSIKHQKGFPARWAYYVCLQSTGHDCVWRMHCKHSVHQCRDAFASTLNTFDLKTGPPGDFKPQRHLYFTSGIPFKKMFVKKVLKTTENLKCTNAGAPERERECARVQSTSLQEKIFIYSTNIKSNFLTDMDFFVCVCVWIFFFNILISSLISIPVEGFAGIIQAFTLHTDSSTEDNLSFPPLPLLLTTAKNVFSWWVENQRVWHFYWVDVVHVCVCLA